MTLLNDRRGNVRCGNSAFAKLYRLSRTTVNDEIGRMEKEKWSN